MNELSLFSGGGGGLLGTKLLGWKHIGYIENDDYCQRIIAQRIRDGILDDSPIFGDIRTFIDEGYAAAYQGMVDVITAGFPCQPFSVAGKQAGEDDPRNMWPATGECIRIIRPRYVLMENVPGLLAPWRRLLIKLIPKSSGWLRRIALDVCYPSYFGRVLGELAESGYCLSWRCLSAAEVGANHKRDRLWIVAHRDCDGRSRPLLHEGQRAKGEGEVDTGGDRQNVADTEGKPERPRLCEGEQAGIGIGRFGDSRCQDNMADGNGTGREERRRSEPVGEEHSASECGSEDVPDAFNDGPYREKGHEAIPRSNQQENGIFKRGCDWPIEPDVGRVAHGVASRVDRLKALGNGQVPAVVRSVWGLLTTERD